MTPTLTPAALCLVDQAQTDVREQDRIWALEYAGMGMVRRVRRTAGGRYRLLADNPVVSDIEAGADEITVLGRVVWRGGSI
jgi:phage repressor protein C with HTH and peptisase S24 domain